MQKDILKILSGTLEQWYIVSVGNLQIRWSKQSRQ